jgi:hypothetical protein
MRGDRRLVCSASTRIVAGSRHERRELQLGYRIEAYRRLERATNRPFDRDAAATLESAVADIQLLGSPQQVEMARDFAREFAANRAASVEDLLESLRNNLRHELRLPAVPRGVLSLRAEFGAEERTSHAQRTE